MLLAIFSSSDDRAAFKGLSHVYLSPAVSFHQFSSMKESNGSVHCSSARIYSTSLLELAALNYSIEVLNYLWNLAVVYQICRIEWEKWKTEVNSVNFIERIQFECRNRPIEVSHNGRMLINWRYPNLWVIVQDIYRGRRCARKISDGWWDLFSGEEVPPLAYGPFGMCQFSACHCAMM